MKNNMTNCIMTPEFKDNCKGCMYNSKSPTDYPCESCARNNTSGYYYDNYETLLGE